MNQLINKVIVFSLLIVLAPVSSMADHSHGYNKATEAFNAGNYEMAVHLWGEEAAEGDINAQEMLGAMYASGKGVKLDNAEAIKWYQKAANQGSASAQFNLGKIYSQGNGTEKKLDHAYAWWLISAAGGNTGARERLKTLPKEMTQEQLEKAKQLTFDFLHTISK